MIWPARVDGITKEKTDIANKILIYSVRIFTPLKKLSFSSSHQHRTQAEKQVHLFPASFRRIKVAFKPL
jgi:hypothetical protein